MKKYGYIATIMKHPNLDAVYVEFPFDVEKEFGTKGQVKVKAQFDGIEYRGSLARMGLPCHFIGITKEIRKKINKGPGDQVKVVIVRDEEERTVEVPADVLTSLDRDAASLAFFKGLSYSHQREYINWIKEAKKEETRRKRVSEFLELMRSGKKTRNEKR